MAKKFFKDEEEKAETFFSDEKDEGFDGTISTLPGKISGFNIKKETLRQNGIIRLILPSRIVVEYGEGLGTDLPFDSAIHSKLKEGDEISLP